MSSIEYDTAEFFVFSFFFVLFLSLSLPFSTTAKKQSCNVRLVHFGETSNRLIHNLQYRVSSRFRLCRRRRCQTRVSQLYTDHHRTISADSIRMYVYRVLVAVQPHAMCTIHTPIHTRARYDGDGARSKYL